MDVKRKLPLNAAHLRLLAMALMLMDHMWATVVPGNFWLTCLGRLAFPIFAFQITEGYFHTSNFKRYAGRLLVFALIAEVPFDLMMSGAAFYPFHQNVLFTLLLGLLGVRAMDLARKEQAAGRWLKSLGVVMAVSLLGGVLLVDYGMVGVLTVIVFGVLREIPFAKLGQLLAMVLLHAVFMEGQVFPVGAVEIPLQSLAVLSLPLIWLYNGEKGRGGRLLQYGSYVFYPLHMAVLYLISRIG